MPVVFAKYGNTFEVRMVELGESNGEYVEVLSGIKPGTEYVTENSFLLKADVLKDGASHDH
jgi:cobalt-zinc-cadmium efflux system membrane fusion protein